MAPIFRHGKGTRLLVDKYDMSPFFNSVTVNGSMAPADVTVFQQNDHNYVVGLRNLTAAFAGFFNFSTGTSTSVDAVFAAALGTTTPHAVTTSWDPASTGTRAMLINAYDVKYDVHAPVANAVSVVLDMQGLPNANDMGVWLKALASTTSTKAYGAVQNGSTGSGTNSTNGGVGHLHVTTSSGAITNLTAKIQHSTSGSTWADLIVFTATTQTTFQRTTVAGTIKKKLRATTTTFTGGGSKKATFAVAFARRGKII